MSAAAARPPVVAVVGPTASGKTGLSLDLAERLHAAREAAGVPLACASTGGRTHPPVGVWPVSLRTALREALLRGGGLARRRARLGDRAGGGPVHGEAQQHDQQDADRADNAEPRVQHEEHAEGDQR